MDRSSAFKELTKRVREASLLGSCAELLGWDERTQMPPRGSGHRAEQMALLARLIHEQRMDPRIGELLDVLGEDGSDADESATLREIRRGYERAKKVPATLVEELARVTTIAQPIWADARANNDFKKFLPSLEQIVKLKREEADAVGFTDSPYDALLDEYEPGARTAEVRSVFEVLRGELSELVRAIQASPKRPRSEILHQSYPVEVQELFGKEAALVVGFEFEAGRLDVTTHPFCCGIGPGDCRITTRYNPNFFNESFFGTLHEAGHAIYEQGLREDQFGLPLGTAVSLGVHESQSRFWENQVGRSRSFWEHFYPRAVELFPEALKTVDLEAFYFAINEVQPSFIRVEADEVTYNLHIILRFELEQALILGDLSPSDVPTAWNERFEKSFGLIPKEDSQGCLQDIHWSCGGIGYFPTYTLGNLYSAQFMVQAKKDLGDLDTDFRSGNFQRVKGWLNEKIHTLGSRHRPTDLCVEITGQPLSPQPLIDYLREKFTPLYDL